MPKIKAKDIADKIVRCLLEGDKERDLAEILNNEIEGTKIVRDPSLSNLSEEQQKGVMKYWQKLRRINGIPDGDTIDLKALGDAQNYLKLVDVVDDDDNFRYAVCGDEIIRTTGTDMTGRSVLEAETKSRSQIFEAACYMAARRLKRPFYTVFKSTKKDTASPSHRLILPLGKNGQLIRLLVCDLEHNTQS